MEGVAAPLEVEVAETQAQRNRGLMQRDSLAGDAGMLFLFDGPMAKGVGFYMYRTLIPLDVAFADPDGRIVSIMTMTPCPHEDPRRCKVYRPGRAFVSALEVNAGFFERHGVEKGDRLFDPQEGRCDLAPDDEPITGGYRGNVSPTAGPGRVDSRVTARKTGYRPATVRSGLPALRLRLYPLVVPTDTSYPGISGDPTPVQVFKTF